jgi:diaminobutyrate-2-oxoglutarate transaminase
MYRSKLDTWEPGAHIGTFRGSLTSMAAGAAALRFLEKHSLPEHAARLGSHMLGRLSREAREMKYVGDVRGAGLIMGIEFVKDGATKEPWPEMAGKVRTEAFRRGLITERGGHSGNVVRFLPPLVLTKDLADAGIDIFLEVVRSLEK